MIPCPTDGIIPWLGEQDDIPDLSGEDCPRMEFDGIPDLSGEDCPSLDEDSIPDLSGEDAIGDGWGVWV